MARSTDPTGGAPPTGILQGTLDLLILRSLEAEGDLHGYGVARHIEQTSGQVWKIEEGSLYPALRRLEARGDVEAAWRVNETGRRARFYGLTTRGRARLAAEKSWWIETVRTMTTFLGAPAGGQVAPRGIRGATT